MDLFSVTLVIFLFNIPFGYWRANVKKFSFQWFLSIHVPVPFVVLLRIYSDVGFIWYSYPLFIGSFFAGQYLGKRIYALFRSGKRENLSSFLFADILKR